MTSTLETISEIDRLVLAHGSAKAEFQRAKAEYKKAEKEFRKANGRDSSFSQDEQGRKLYEAREHMGESEHAALIAVIEAHPNTLAEADRKARHLADVLRGSNEEWILLWALRSLVTTEPHPYLSAS